MPSPTENILTTEEAAFILITVNHLITSINFDALLPEQALRISGAADSIKYKLETREAKFTVDESAMIMDALLAFRASVNKLKATARKGTALYKRTHRSYKHVEALIAKFNAAQIRQSQAQAE